MQSFDDQQKLINSGIYKDGLEVLRAAAKELEKEEVKQVRVGKFPKVDEELTVNGMKCSVVMANPKKKRFTLEML